MFHTDFMYKFQKEYEYEDFRDFLFSFHVIGLKSDDRTKRNFVSLFYSDYLQKRVNSFSYLNNIKGIDIRTLMELRKSALPRLPIEFYQQHPEPTVGWKEIKQYRTSFLKDYYMDYQDENWQYWWVLWSTLGGKQAQNLRFVYEDLVEGGDPRKDEYGNPLAQYCKKITIDTAKKDGYWYF